MQEGNTLLDKSPKTSRIPQNTNARVESLCVMTADIEMARKLILTPEEDMCLMVAYELDPNLVPNKTLQRAEDALEKLVAYLN